MQVCDPEEAEAPALAPAGVLDESAGEDIDSAAVKEMKAAANQSVAHPAASLPSSPNTKVIGLLPTHPPTPTPLAAAALLLCLR